MSDITKMVTEMQVQLRTHQVELQKTLSAIDSVSRNNTVIENSMQDIKKGGQDYVWEAVGRSFVKTGIPEYESQMKNQIRDNIDMMNSLNKKKHYLETSIKNTIDSLKKVFVNNQST